jgi:hypothetical protein
VDVSAHIQEESCSLSVSAVAAGDVPAKTELEIVAPFQAVAGVEAVPPAIAAISPSTSR